MKRKILTTAETGREVLPPPELVPLRGLSTDEAKGGKIELTAREFCERFGTAEDFELLRKTIEARKVKEQTNRRRLPGGVLIPGDSILGICNNPKCGRQNWTAPDAIGTSCLWCNSMNYKDGGRIRAGSEIEIQAWTATEEERARKWKADAPRRQAEVESFNRRLFQDHGFGG